ncbi:MAG: PQQ-dependent dehydrogenase, methanol/ethanol family [Gammaproteobacteria bacterium]|nr:PQQ-dependent dehydrogenase, methanol/ethanol family [Gammaproteobacteria bacterium]
MPGKTATAIRFREIGLLSPIFLVGLLLGAGEVQAGAGEEWTQPGGDMAGTRYSELAEITPENAGKLRMVWNFSTGVLGGHEGQPLVVDDTLYVVTPWPNVLYAFDLTQEDYPLRFKYRPDANPAAIGIACCDAVNRGAVHADGKIVYNLLDGRTVAVDAKTGQELWKTTVADLASGETLTMAPLVAGNRVLVGPSGGEFGIRGSLKALDLETGAIVWQMRNLGPDTGMGVKQETFKPSYPPAPNAGTDTWAEESWERGGAPVWGWLSYDPALDLVYYGTGNPGPYNAEQRLGDNKWSASVMARKPGDGSLVWAYQFTPFDNWDYDATAENILVDLEIDGRVRKALVHFDKNGFAYALDRATGEVLVAEPYVPVNWATGVDKTTGRPLVVPEKLTGKSHGLVKNICPTLEGGKGPSAPAAWSPRTKLFYVPTLNLCMDWQSADAIYVKGTPYVGATIPYHPGAGPHLGGFMAWDAAAGRKKWEVNERFPVWSGSLVTAGDVAFYGTLDGWFKAIDANTGKPLWKFKVGSGVIGAPISYRGPDGRQYIAVYSGIGGDWSLVAGDVNSADPADVRPPTDFAPDLARYTSQGGMVWVFAL